MTKFSAYSLFFGGVLVALSGCGNGANQGAKLSRCAKNYDPVVITTPTGDAAKKQVQIKPGDALQIPTGDYGYSSADVFYHEIENDVKIHITEAQDKMGAFNASVVCLAGRGINPKMQTVEETLKIASDLMVDSNGYPYVRHRTLQFRLGKPVEGSKLWLVGPTVPDTGVDKSFLPGSPADTFSGFTEVTQYILDTTTDQKKPTYQLLTLLRKPVNAADGGTPGTAEIKIRVTLTSLTADDRAKRDNPKKPTPDHH